MLASGGHVAIGIDDQGEPMEYMLLEGTESYVHRFESLFSQSTAIAGEIAKNQLRPEKLLWSLTDFSGGEGSPIYYPQDPTAYDIGSLANISNAGLMTSRPRRRQRTDLRAEVRGIRPSSHGGTTAYFRQPASRGLREPRPRPLLPPKDCGVATATVGTWCSGKC